MSETRTGSSARWTLISLAAVFAVGKLLYMLLHAGHLEQTSAFFVFMPALLAIMLAFTATPKSVTGVIMKGMTILLLLAGVLLGEGMICILMAAPLFYLVGFLIGLAIDSAEKRRRERMNTKTFGLILLPFLSLSLEGVTPSLSFSRVESITVTKLVEASPVDVERSLASPPEMDRPVPIFFRLPFPRPLATWGEGLELGSYRGIRFTAMDEPPGILVLRVVGRAPSFVRFAAESDTSMIAEWLTWQGVDIQWEPVSAQTTRVRWTLRYLRRLDPAWYFGPWERYAVGATAGYLIDAAATPRAGQSP